MPLTPSPRRRSRLRVPAVLLAAGLIPALSAVPASAHTVARHAPVASAADDSGDATVTDPSGDDYTTDPSGDDYTSDPSGDDTTIDPSGDDTIDPDGTVEDPSGDDYVSDPSGDDTTIDPSGDDTTVDPSGDDVSGDDSTGDDSGDVCDDSGDTSDSGDDTSDDGTVVCDDSGDDDGTTTTTNAVPRLTGLHAKVVKHHGLRITFKLDQAGRVTMTLQAEAAGVTSGSRCVVPKATTAKSASRAKSAKAAKKKGKACVSTTTVAGSVPVTGTDGANTTSLTKWHGHVLAAGSYILTATPKVKGAKPDTATFHIASAAH